MAPKNDNWPSSSYIFFWSLYTIKTSPLKYTVSTVIEVSQKSEPQSTMPNINQDLLGLLNPSLGSNSQDRILAILTGNKFLFSLIDTYPELIREDCAFSTPKKLSLYGILSVFGIYQKKPNSNNQLKTLQAQCIMSLFKVGKYKYNNNVTNAFEISIEDVDPKYAASLANAIVEHFFLLEVDKANNFFDKKLSTSREIG